MDVRIRITRVTDDAELASQIEPKMRALGQAIGARAQRLVPKRTYDLNDTISTDTVVIGSKVVTTVGAGSGDVDYALYVERGTSKMKAQPYLRPALLQTKASDLGYAGKGIMIHGHVTPSSARSRRRSRGRS